MHDFNGGIAPSGLFWTLRVPDDALQIRGRSAHLKVEDVPLVDSFTFLGPTEVPATVSFDITFDSTGKVRHLRPTTDDPTDPHAFAGEFRDAVATGEFSGSEEGFSFTAEGSSEDAWGEMGTERNGFFLN